MEILLHVSPLPPPKKNVVYVPPPNLRFLLKHIENFSSKLAINKIAYEGANFVPIAVPRTCLKVFSSNSKILFFSTISARSIRVSLEICLLSLNSKNQIIFDLLLVLLSPFKFYLILCCICCFISYLCNCIYHHFYHYLSCVIS